MYHYLIQFILLVILDRFLVPNSVLVFFGVQNLASLNCFCSLLRTGFSVTPCLPGRRAFGLSAASLSLRSSEHEWSLCFTLFSTRLTLVFILGAFLELFLFIFLWCFNASIFIVIMPKTPRYMSTAPSTISRPPSDSVTPVSVSVSVPVIVSDSALTSSSGSGISSVPLSSELIANEPLSGGQSDRDLFQ